jgi:hypothetical protein
MSNYGSYSRSYETEESSSSGQVISALGVVALLFIVGLVGEIIYKTIYEARGRYQTILDYTADAQDGSIIIHQDISKFADAKPIKFSVNERTGIEFSYSFFIYVNSSMFDTGADSTVFRHIFHKGHALPWPLMGPGVFMNATTNTMRVIMNTYKNPYAYADIIDIPLEKWVHVTLNCYNNGLDIFINGGLADRIPFTDTLPYQNFQDVNMFYKGSGVVLNGSSGPTVLGSGNSITLTGGFSGKISNIVYTRYAVSVTEILKIMNTGPSGKMSAKVSDSQFVMSPAWLTSQQKSLG